MYKNLITTQNQGILTITINRPDKLNALNKETIAELNQQLKQANADNNVKVIVITGSGTKAFVAGADIAEFASFSVEEGKQLAKQGHNNLFDFIENLNKPCIAAVNGFALGGGLELAMACHFRLASTNAKMGLPEVSLGVIPGYGGTQRLAQLIGKGRANEIIFSAGMLTAEQALQYGLVNHVVSQDELLPKCYEIAQKIAANSTVAIKYAISAVNAGFAYNINGFDAEIDAFGACFGTEDFKEGTTAFLEKRKPNFPGK